MAYDVRSLAFVLGLLCCVAPLACGPKAEDGAEAGDTEDGDADADADGDADADTDADGDADADADADTDADGDADADTDADGDADADADGDGDGDGAECEVDADCELVTDCCTCDAVPLGGRWASCDAACEQDRCERLSIDEAECRYGVCVAKKKTCDASNILCNGLPPDCSEGTVPGVDADGTCWSGDCVPALYCDVVSDCATCDSLDLPCVEKAFQSGPIYECVEPHPGCEGTLSCGCAGALICTDLLDTCADGNDGDLSCACVDC